MAKEVYTIDELAQMLGVGKAYIYKLTAKREIGFFTLGKRKGIRFAQEDVDAWLKANRRKSQTEVEMNAATYCATHRKEWRTDHQCR